MLSQNSSVNPVPDRLVASMAVSNFDCLLVESLQWDEFKTQALPQTPTRFLLSSAITNLLLLFAPLVRTHLFGSSATCSAAPPFCQRFRSPY